MDTVWQSSPRMVVYEERNSAKPDHANIEINDTLACLWTRGDVLFDPVGNRFRSKREPKDLRRYTLCSPQLEEKVIFLHQSHSSGIWTITSLFATNFGCWEGLTEMKRWKDWNSNATPVAIQLVFNDDDDVSNRPFLPHFSIQFPDRRVWRHFVHKLLPTRAESSVFLGQDFESAAPFPHENGHRLGDSLPFLLRSDQVFMLYIIDELAWRVNPVAVGKCARARSHISHSDGPIFIVWRSFDDCQRNILFSLWNISLVSLYIFSLVYGLVELEYRPFASVTAVDRVTIARPPISFSLSPSVGHPVLFGSLRRLSVDTILFDLELRI